MSVNFPHSARHNGLIASKILILTCKNRRIVLVLNSYGPVTLLDNIGDNIVATFHARDNIINNRIASSLTRNLRILFNV